MDYRPLIGMLILAAILFVFNLPIIGIGIVALAVLLMFGRKNLLGVFLFILGILFVYLGEEGFGLILFLLGIVVMVYSPLDDTAKKAWEEMKKAEAPYPAAKLEATAKGFSKSAAEMLVPPPNTEVNGKAFIDKSPKVAGNFFKELKEFFK